MRFKTIFFIGILALLTSCGSWSKQDKDKFIESCQMQKLNDDFCKCALDKALLKYNTFDEMTSDQEEMAKLLFSCIEENRKKEK